MGSFSGIRSCSSWSHCRNKGNVMRSIIDGFSQWQNALLTTRIVYVIAEKLFWDTMFIDDIKLALFIHSFIHSFSSFFIHLDSNFFCSATTIAWRPLLRARNRPWSFFRLGFEATSTRWATRRSPNWANRAAALNALVSADSHVYAENPTYTYNSWPRYWASRICMNITDYFSPTICINLNLRPCSTDKSKTHFEFLSVFAFLRLILNSNRARQIAEKQLKRKVNYHS